MAIGILVLAVSAGLVGCQKKVEKSPYDKIVDQYFEKIVINETKTTKKSESEQVALVEQMKQLNKAQVSSKEIFELFTNQIAGMSSPHSDEFAAYAVSGMQANSFKDTVKFDPYFSTDEHHTLFFDLLGTYDGNYLTLKHNISQIENAELKKYFEQASAEGYLLVSTEGYIMPVVDFTEFAKYRNQYSPEFAGVINQLAFNNVEVLVNDGGLMISTEALFARLLEAEKVLEKGQPTQYQKFLALIYAENLRVLLTGAENTPAFDYESMKVREDALENYKKISSFNNGKTATAVKAHVAALEVSNGKYDESVFLKADELVQQVHDTYQISESDITAYQNWLSGQMK